MSYPPTPLVNADAQLIQSSFLGQVYAWMTAGLLVQPGGSSWLSLDEGPRTKDE
jgi:FtsH-binding integral membrane protein